MGSRVEDGAHEDLTRRHESRGTIAAPRPPFALDTVMRLAILASLVLVGLPQTGLGQRLETPIGQSSVPAPASAPRPLTLRDASRNDRWLGLGARDLRWALDGSVLYFRWSQTPGSDDVPDADPWFKTDAAGTWVEQVTAMSEIRSIPGPVVEWSPNGHRGAWASEGAVFLFEGGTSRQIVSLGVPIRSARFVGDDVVEIVAGEALYRYAVDDGSVRLAANRHTVIPGPATAEGQWLSTQQEELFAHVRDQVARRDALAAAARMRSQIQSIPVEAGHRVEDIRTSPDGRYLVFSVRQPGSDRPATQYMDYLDDSGYSAVKTAREKVGEPRDVVRLGIVRVAPTEPADSVQTTWVSLPEAGDQRTVPHGPYWSPDGERALVQFIGEDHKDVWYAELDLPSGTTTVIAHDHDEGWIGGPPVQANYLQPALLNWLLDGSWVFASERSGWSHLYRVDPAGVITPLTSGAWEVRGAELSRDRTFWLLQASREHPSDDHLYRLPAEGGEMIQLSEGPGRNEGRLSPDGERVAVVHSTAVGLPDLFMGRPRVGDLRRVTQSGSDNFVTLALKAPTIVSFPHPDGDPIWGALYVPDSPHPDRPAVIHVHGGGYRQFAHRGWSVYGWGLHVGYLNYLVQQGYTVLDFDYRGGAGFGRDYRTDVAGAMGIKDADGVAAAARYLSREHGVDPTRIGMHGVSYGGFLTLMTLFRHPGVVSAGIARASVTDWAHYSDGWTSRILGVPHRDPETYERSSPIYYAEGLEDPLLLTHGLVDDNVHFQDDARLVQKLIELEKEFEVMYYPVEPHTIETEPSRYDFVRRATAFFERHLIRN